MKQNETLYDNDQNTQNASTVVGESGRSSDNPANSFVADQADFGSVTDDEIAKSVRDWNPNPRFVADAGRVDSVADSVRVEPDSVVAQEPVQRVAHVEKMPDVQPVAPKQKTVKKQTDVQRVAPKGKARRISKLPESVQMEGFSWRPDGFTGWNLWKRTPALSANGKRSSKHKWVAHYKKAAMERLINETKKRKTA